MGPKVFSLVTELSKPVQATIIVLGTAVMAIDSGRKASKIAERLVLASVAAGTLTTLVAAKGALLGASWLLHQIPTRK